MAVLRNLRYADLSLTNVIRTCYSPRYEAQTTTASMRKLGPVSEAAARAGLVELIDPDGIEVIPLLRELHHPSYVDAFLTGTPAQLASANGWNWTSEIRDGVLAIQQGQIVGARLALQHGIAANIAQGFHHARYERGAGFCTFNGLALVALQHSHLKVCVIDCDEHAGDGTQEFTGRLANLMQVSIFGVPMRPARGRNSLMLPGNALSYMERLGKAFAQVDEWMPDLILYQAGADCHEDDPLGCSGLTSAQMRQRDRLVFHYCRSREIPCLFVLAGGYQEPIKEKLVPLHLQTFEEAVQVYGRTESR